MDFDKSCQKEQIKEAVCIETKKIYDSVRDRDCLEDLRVYLTECGQEVVDRASSVKVKKAEVLWVYVDLEPVTFNKGYFQVDVTYYFRVECEANLGCAKPTIIEGLCVYNKRAIMCGGEGGAKIFSSTYVANGCDIPTTTKTNLPNCEVEVVDPIALGCRIIEPCHNVGCCEEIDIGCIPEVISGCFNESFARGFRRKLVVSLGLFTIIRISRNVQLMIPTYDFCMPHKESECGTNEAAPCDLFKKFKFPIDEFFPQNCESNSNNCCK